MTAIDPNKFKEDGRSPSELARAILDHQLVPPKEGEDAEWTFREQLLYDTGNPLHAKANGVVLTLRKIAGEIPISNHEKTTISYALEVVDAYRKECKGLRDSNISLSRGHDILSRSEEQKKEAADLASDNLVEIMNCDRIEQLVRALGAKLGIQMIEPNQRGG